MRAGYSAEGLRAGEQAIRDAKALSMPLWLAHGASFGGDSYLIHIAPAIC